MPDLKISKSYTIAPVNATWLQTKAAELTIQTGTSISASEIIDRLIADAREDGARFRRILNAIVSEAFLA